MQIVKPLYNCARNSAGLGPFLELIEAWDLGSNQNDAGHPSILQYIFRRSIAPLLIKIPTITAGINIYNENVAIPKVAEFGLVVLGWGGLGASAIPSAIAHEAITN